MNIARIIFSALAVSLLASAGAWADDDHHRSQITAPKNALYQSECASCHMAYPPHLLGAAAWGKLMGNLKNHFGTNASLDAQDQKNITLFLQAHAGERGTSPASSASQNSIRITETRYFLRKHDEISATVFKRKSIGGAWNCIACHRGAERGDFDEDAVKIPR